MVGIGAKVDFCQEKMRKDVTSYLPDSFMSETVCKSSEEHPRV